MVAWEKLDVAGWREAAVRHGAVATAQAALDLAQQHAALNCFTVLLAERALERAAFLDTLPPQQRGLLHGVPVAIKDENDVAGAVTSFGTACNTTPKTRSSLLVQRLETAGAIVIGKTTMPAFGAFPFTESEAFGVTANPAAPGYTPGGSSGGSAAAVAAGIVPIAIGGDGGGSIRIPADRCGVVGLKPARGAVPTAPYTHLWHVLGVAGPLTKNVQDALLVYRVLTDDAHSLRGAEPALPQLPAERLRIAVNLRPASPFAKLAADNRRAVVLAAQRLRQLGHQVEFIRLRHPDPTPPFVVQFFAGILSEMQSLEHPEKIEKRHLATRRLGFWARGRVLRWAKQRSERIGATVALRLTGFDVLLTPTCASRPERAGILRGVGSMRAMILSVPCVAYTVLWNVAGNTALTVPVGRGADGLPSSVQLVSLVKHPGQAAAQLAAVGAELENRVE